MRRSASKNWSLTTSDSFDESSGASSNLLPVHAEAGVNRNGSSSTSGNGSNHTTTLSSAGKQSSAVKHAHSAPAAQAAKRAANVVGMAQSAVASGATSGQRSRTASGPEPPSRLRRKSSASTVSYITERSTFILLGDSLTQQAFTRGGWGQLIGDLYVRRADVLNRGYSGYNTRWALQLLPFIFTEDKVRFVLRSLCTTLLSPNDPPLPPLSLFLRHARPAALHAALLCLHTVNVVLTPLLSHLSLPAGTGASYHLLWGQ
jgi:hypothetical protein